MPSDISPIALSSQLQYWISAKVDWNQATWTGLTHPKMVAVQSALNQLCWSLAPRDRVILERALFDLMRDKDCDFLDRKYDGCIKKLWAIVHQAQIAIMAQEFAKKRLYDPSSGLPTALTKESNELLKTLADRIKEGAPDCMINYGPIKQLESASRKVTDEYGGDWLQVKDAVRLTIIATNRSSLLDVPQEKLDLIKARIKALCGGPSTLLTFIKDEDADPKNAEKNPCAYSGYNCVVRLNRWAVNAPAANTGPLIKDENTYKDYFAKTKVERAPLPGEIQANIPTIMYGKMSKKDLITLFGEPQFNALAQECFLIEGGIGHIFYEIYRSDKTGQNGKDAAALSKRYHDFLRSLQKTVQEKQDLTNAIEAFKAIPKNKTLFDGKDAH